MDTTSGLNKVEFSYDYKHRRIGKQVSEWQTDDWSLLTEHWYVYDGWNLIQETTTTDSGDSTDFYVWGLDLSGSLQGAGGIGGLLMRQTDSGEFLYLYDANGNVGQLVNAADGALAAHYEYDPFGNLLVATGSEAGSNPFRFSTKSLDTETGLSYYGYRYYSSELGRWTTRDPIGERGGINLYGFVGNNPTTLYDLLGLITVVEVLETFFSSSTMERLWYMGENDEYTQRMRQWDVLEDRLNGLKRNLEQNCEIWEKIHRTDPSWEPSYTDPPDEPTNAVEEWVSDPPGTDPGTAKAVWEHYQRTGEIPEQLWYAAVGSFGIFMTVDNIDCCKKTATLKIWLYNSMDKDSFNWPLVIAYCLSTPGRQGMARQYNICGGLGKKTMLGNSNFKRAIGEMPLRNGPL